MSHFAKIENNLVTNVIVAEQDFVDSHCEGTWLQTSYNTKGNIHYGQDGEPDGGVALRGNYAGVGYTYDATNDVFIAPKPYDSWLLDEDTWSWKAPTPMPDDGNMYMWNEDTQSWDLIVE